MRATRLQHFIELLVGCLLCSLSPGSFGQTVFSPIPMVTIRATDPLASWSDNPAVFTVYRSGDPQPSLNIYYRISGTASNGWDYQTIGNFMQIPSGVMAGNIVIQPINRGQTSDATVELTLAPSPLMSPLAGAFVNYIIGSPSNATAVITSKALTNVPPLVDLVFPTNGAVFFTPLNLPLVACASDPDGFVRQVEFFANGKSLGVVTNSPIILPPTPGPLAPLPPLPPYRPFVLAWTNVPPGTNILLTATATDNTGATTTSTPVSITVHPGPPPPPPPPGLVVRITSPANGAIFRAPVNLPIYAYAAELTASALGNGAFVTGVEFFAGTNDLGPGRRVVPPMMAGSPVPSPVSNLWTFVWSNVPPGIFPLTAVATDSRGALARSEVVNVSILPLPPPPPVLTDVVSIVAVDPVAIEGTNCWPWLGLASVTPTWPNWTASTAVCRYFTNCGPRNAMFVVHRFGPTNADLSVSYAIGGTATNGVDYLTLPGAVTIAAGQHSALIPVVPLDDGPPDINSTVVLKLKPSPDYLIGRPAAAAAIILDWPSPRAVSGLLPDQSFHLRATGPDGAWFHVESTADLLHWTPICTNQVVNGSIDFIDPDAAANAVRFYRAVPEAAAP